MRRLLTACAFLSLAGCLDPGDPVLGVRDTNPPKVVSPVPGEAVQIASNGTLEITFSEFMDVRTLRPGITVLASSGEVPLTITVPAPTEGDDIEHGDIPYTVKATATSGAFSPNASYTLVLRTILSDYEGNPLPEEVRVLFRTGP